MSKIEELITKHCPDGVEYKTLGELGFFYSGLTGKSKDDFKDGNAKFITYMNVYSNPALNIHVKDTVRIGDNEKQNEVLFGDVLFTGSSETPDECGMSSVVTEQPIETMYLNSFCFGFRFNEQGKFSPLFLKHLFRSFQMRHQIAKTASGVTRFNVSKKRFANIQIPMVPIEIQNEIASILDNFTTLEAELEAELEARRKQYEYYRNKLLCFNEIGGGIESQVIWMKMSEIFHIKNGYTPSKANPDYWTNGTIPWFRMEDIRANGRILSDSIQHITPEAVKGGKLFPANSIIVATTATIGEHALIIADSLANQRFTFLTKRESLIPDLDMKYMYYYMFIVDEWCKKNTNVSGFASVDMGKFKNYLVPIPPLPVQQRIVNVLDNFESLCADLNIGLPAEIEARRKQYEYYRNRLLTFTPPYN